VQAPDVHAYDNYNFTYCTPGPACPVRTRILARNVVTTSSLFTYYTKAAATLPVPLESVPANLQAVDSIDIFLTVRTAQRVEGTTVTTRVMLPNADSAPTPSATP
jgi:hypothetical protein